MSSSYSSESETNSRSLRRFSIISPNSPLPRRRGTGQGTEKHGIPHHTVLCHTDGKPHGGFDRLIANLAGRRVDDTAQTQLVRRIFDHPQVGEHVLDLGAREEIAALVHAECGMHARKRRQCYPKARCCGTERRNLPIFGPAPRPRGWCPRCRQPRPPGCPSDADGFSHRHRGRSWLLALRPTLLRITSFAAFRMLPVER